MIGRLRGVLVEKAPPFLLIDIAGVGYECQAPMTTVYQLPEIGAEVTLHSHLSIREDAHTLFVFQSKKDRELFRALIKVNGVGPKLALAILSGMEAAEFVTLVHEGKSQSLTKLPGVGKKTAERLIIEMKDRLKDWQPLGATSTGDTPQPSLAIDRRAQEAEAISALVALGYKPQEASKAITQVSGSDTEQTTAEQLIRLALKNMAK